MNRLTKRSEILLNAAEKLRQRLEAQPNDVQSIGLLYFLLGSHCFSLPLTAVANIARVPAITFIPNTPSFVRGIANLRGNLVPILDLADLLEIKHESRESGVVLTRSDDRPYGILTHSIPDYFRITPDGLEASPRTSDRIDSVVTHTCQRNGDIVALIDPKRLEALIARQTDGA